MSKAAKGARRVRKKTLLTPQEPLSQAGNGAIFRPAEDVEAANPVVVELLSQSAAQDPEQVKLFYLEAEAAARLQHPQIARACAAEPFALTHQRCGSLQPGLPAAETLRELLSRGGWFEPQRAVRVIAQVAGALAYVHQAACCTSTCNRNTFGLTPPIGFSSRALALPRRNSWNGRAAFAQAVARRLT